MFKQKHKIDSRLAIARRNLHFVMLAKLGLPQLGADRIAGSCRVSLRGTTEPVQQKDAELPDFHKRFEAKLAWKTGATDGEESINSVVNGCLEGGN